MQLMAVWKARKTVLTHTTVLKIIAPMAYVTMIKWILSVSLLINAKKDNVLLALLRVAVPLLLLIVMMV
jgi:hypothetical protein